MKFRKRVIKDVDAEQFDGTKRGAERIADKLNLYQDHWNYLDLTHRFLCKNWGDIPRIAEKGDWIIKRKDGKIYPCKSDIFNLDYEEVV